MVTRSLSVGGPGPSMSKLLSPPPVSGCYTSLPHPTTSTPAYLGVLLHQHTTTRAAYYCTGEYSKGRRCYTITLGQQVSLYDIYVTILHSCHYITICVTIYQLAPSLVVVPSTWHLARLMHSSSAGRVLPFFLGWHGFCILFT